MSDTPDYALAPEVFATLVEQASDEQLERGLAENRELMLAGIFEQMPASLDPERAGDVDAVLEWRIREGPGGGPDRYQVTIRGGRCTVERDGGADPSVSYELSAVDFVKLVAGVEQGPKLFVFGRLKVRGNLLLAARVPTFFRMPRPGEAA